MFLGKTLVAAAVVAMLANPANAACWSDAAYKAAQIRELDTMLMVEALRCRKTRANFVGDYNRFIVANRPTLIKANAALKAHFAAQVGEKGALNAYDRYMTTVANRYGAGSEGMDCRDVAGIVDDALAAKGSAEALYQIADRADLDPNIRGRRCPGGGSPALKVAARR